MPTIPFHTADVFTSERFGGNQLAVFPDAREIPSQLMPSIAREFNFSETAFVLPSEHPGCIRRVRIFTPGAELPFAGHPTIGTAFVLASIGVIPLTGDETRVALEEGVGPVPVTIRMRGGGPGFTQLSVARLPEVGPPPPAVADLARCVGLAEADIVGGEYAPQAVSCGGPFLFLRLHDRATLARARPVADEFARVLRDYWASDVYLFCDDPERDGSDLRARMFAPYLGLPEDPATGSACAALGGFLGARDARADGTLRWVVEQGFEMGRPSLLHVEVDKRAGAVTGVRVGGETVLVTRGELLL